MIKRCGWILVVALLAVVGCAQPPAESEPPASPPEEPATPAQHAMATIEPKSGSKVSGAAHFNADGAAITMTLEIAGAPPGEHAVHLHEVGDCSAADGTSAGGHWNPTAADHGRWGVDPYHRGDIGNIKVGADGSGKLTLTSKVWTIGGAPETDIVGKSVIVHAAADDFTSQPTGNAGGRIGCGVIALAPSGAGG